MVEVFILIVILRTSAMILHVNTSSHNANEQFAELEQSGLKHDPVRH